MDYFLKRYKDICRKSSVNTVLKVTGTIIIE